MANTRELIVQHWLNLGQPPVDAKLLEALQTDFAEGPDGKTMSPASIARLLADAGAELRYPEILEFDTQWREKLLQTQAGRLSEMALFISGKGLSIAQAEVFITKLENFRQQFEGEGDDLSLRELRRFAVEARQRAQAVAKNRALAEAVRSEQIEIDEWLKVWLQTPVLFKDWLELRRRSAEFRERFQSIE